MDLDAQSFCFLMFIAMAGSQKVVHKTSTYTSELCQIPFSLDTYEPEMLPIFIIRSLIKSS